MALLRFILAGIGIAGIPASMASLIGTFFGLGGWGWILFLWFGFTGMFSLGAIKLVEPKEEGEEDSYAVVAILTALLTSAFAGGVAFALSDLPRQISPLWMLLAPVVVFPLIAIFGRRKQTKQATEWSAQAKRRQ